MESLFATEQGATHFLKEGKIFTPVFTSYPALYDPENQDGVVIALDASLRSPLEWQEALSLASRCVERGAVIVWKFHFDLQEIKSFTNLLHVNSARLALDHFCKTVWPVFERHSFGAILFEGSAQPDDLSEIRLQVPEGDDLLIDYFNFLSYHLHRLGAALPEELLLFAQIDARSLPSPARQAQLFSKERFSHIHPIVRGAAVPLLGLCWKEGLVIGGGLDCSAPRSGEIITGVCFPPDERLTPRALQAFEEILGRLNALAVPYRLFPEEDFNESWYGLERVIVVRETLHPQMGHRHCQGFCVTGGEIISHGGQLGIEGEKRFEEEFRGRGI